MKDALQALHYETKLDEKVEARMIPFQSIIKAEPADDIAVGIRKMGPQRRSMLIIEVTGKVVGVVTMEAKVNHVLLGKD
jgi:hypothetical protein